MAAENGRTIFVHDILGSTMDEARRLAAEGCPAGSVVLAREQSAGRGRVSGRSWRAPEGEALLMTLVMHSESAFIPALPLRVGLGVCQFLEGTLPGLELRLKWPSDVLARAGGWRKICGILVESSGGRALVGIGLNVLQREFGEIEGSGAGSLRMARDAAGLELPLPEVGAASARAAADAVESACARGDWRDLVLARLWARGERVTFAEGHPDGARYREGVLSGIDDSGRILISGDDGQLTAYASGELASGPRPL